MSDIADLNLFAPDGPGSDMGSQRMFAVLRDPKVSQIVANRFDRIFYNDDQGTHAIGKIFPSRDVYERWLNELMKLTDVGYDDVRTARASTIEGSFRTGVLTDIQGSIHITTQELTRREPALTVRKQPRDLVTLDRMLSQNMMSQDMRLFLEQAVRGRLNIMVSGGSGAGKTTLLRALSTFIDPNQRIITCEEIDELHVDDRLPNVVALTTHKKVDEDGRIIRRTELDDLVRESLRMRGDRVWVGETRGKEAYALVKACNSGHDGSLTTIHADDAKQAIRTATVYVMEAGVPEEVARDQVAQAFHLVVQIVRGPMGRRLISEVCEIERVVEGSEVRRNQLYAYDWQRNLYVQTARPSMQLRHALARYGVNYEEVPGRL